MDGAGCLAGQPDQQADPEQETVMRFAFIGALAVLPLMSSAAFAGNEQIYQGDALPVASAPAVTETDNAAYFEPVPTVTLSLSQVASNDTGNERPAVFDGMLATTGGTAFAQE
jgi:hypothetical protein